MSDFLLAILDDVDKQITLLARPTTSHRRKQKYVIKEVQVIGTLNEA